LKQGVLKVQSGAPYRFLIAGGAAALVNWLARFPLELVMPFAAALLGATAIGMTCGFLLYLGISEVGSSVNAANSRLRAGQSGRAVGDVPGSSALARGSPHARF
jgi:hypothetical protein